MPATKINVLVYSGDSSMNTVLYAQAETSLGIGSTVGSVRHVVYTLRRLLSPNYAVIPISDETLLKEPWAFTCAMIVLPGGADVGYCHALNGEGNRKILQFVKA